MIIKILEAANGDSILLSFQDSAGGKRNILIDGGMPKTYFGSGKYGDLHKTVEQIKDRKEKIDLLILTHIDGDHIGGLKKWFEMDKNAFDIISKVWFNSGKTIANQFNQEDNPELNETLDIFETTQTSVPQAIVFEDYINRFKVWDKKIVKSGTPIVEKNGLKITLLSPNDIALTKLLREYKKPKYNYQTAGAETDWKIPIEDFINEESASDYVAEEDKSVANGSSIAFLLSFERKNYLFLGDAHPSIIVSALKDLNITKENPIHVEFLKVSHHGSCKNTNRELLELIKTDNYIISSNSEIHNLPNKRTIARIINHNPNSIFHFNYKNVMDNIFLTEDYAKYRSFDRKIISEWI